MNVMTKSNKNHFLLLSVVWTLLLCLLALQPRALVSVFLHKPVYSSYAHVAGHFIFVLFLAHAVSLWRTGLIVRNLVLAVLVFVFSAVLGVFTEVIQFFARERSPSWIDFKFDMIGTLAGFFFHAVQMSVFRVLESLKKIQSVPSFSPRFLLSYPGFLRNSHAAFLITSGILFLGLDSIQLLTVYCLASCI